MKASYLLHSVTPKAIFITDNGVGMSVTNDAEEVVQDVLHRFPFASDRKIIYRDTDGNWDYLEHDGTKFTGFKFWGGQP